jgi:hypothetical protein
MVIAQITGGLGNQMFQFAAARALSMHLNTELALDLQSFKRDELPLLEVQREFELKAFRNVEFREATPDEIRSLCSNNVITRQMQKMLPEYKRKIYSEKSYVFDKNFFRAKNNVYLKGHWQSEKYFKPYSAQIRKTFELKDVLIEGVKELGKEISKQNSISVHVRRGDYLRLPIILDWHGVLEKDYYLEAIKTIDQEVGGGKVFYFSDDVDWIKKELLPEFDGTIVSEAISKNHYEDFYLMSQCKHNIIANSTFSWWAAWLNANPGKMIIAPKKWYNRPKLNTSDLIPPGWIRL